MLRCFRAERETIDTSKGMSDAYPSVSVTRNDDPDLDAKEVDECLMLEDSGQGRLCPLPHELII